MKYECPSCKIFSEDDKEPISLLCHPLCVFCSTKHTQKELLNWQMDHLDHIQSKHFPIIIRYLYRYFENEINTLKVKN
jgi:hypothetical protein